MASSSWWKPTATSASNSTPAKPAAASAAGTTWLFGQKPAAPPPPPPPPIPNSEDSITSTSSPHVLEMIKSIYLETSDTNGYCYQTAQVRVCTKPDMPALDPSLVGLKWFRAEQGGTFDPLHCDQHQLFQPSVDDIDKRLCVQCYDLADETSATFVEYGPVILDPRVLERSQQSNLKFQLTEMGTSTLTTYEYVCDKQELIRTNSTSRDVLKLTESWQIVSNSHTQVVVDGMRAFDFETPFDRDVATLALRKRFPSQNEAKLLRERVRDLETQLQIAMKKSSMAETGKALAEIQSLKRDLERSNKQQGKLQQDLDQALQAKKAMEEVVRTQEQELRQSTSTGQVLAQVAKLEEQCKSKDVEMTKLQQELQQTAQQAAEFPAMQIQVGTAARRVAELEQKLTAVQDEAQRLAGRRNASAQKAESLAKDMARLLRICPGGVDEVDAVQRENARLKQALTELRSEVKQMRLQSNHASSAAAVGSSSTGSSFSGRPPLFGISLPGKALSSSQQANKDPNQLGALANSLVLEVRAKDEQIEMLESTIEKLNIRNAELTRRLRDRGGEMTE